MDEFTSHSSPLSPTTVVMNSLPSLPSKSPSSPPPPPLAMIDTTASSGWVGSKNGTVSSSSSCDSYDGSWNGCDEIPSLSDADMDEWLQCAKSLPTNQQQHVVPSRRRQQQRRSPSSSSLSFLHRPLLSPRQYAKRFESHRHVTDHETSDTSTTRTLPEAVAVVWSVYQCAFCFAHTLVCHQQQTLSNDDREPMNHQTVICPECHFPSLTNDEY